MEGSVSPLNQKVLLLIHGFTVSFRTLKWYHQDATDVTTFHLSLCAVLSGQNSCQVTVEDEGDLIGIV